MCAVDEIILRELAEPAHATQGRVAVIDDPSGALVGAVTTAVMPRVVAFSCDSLHAERAVTAYAESAPQPIPTAAGLDAELLTDVDLVVLHLPQSLGALDEIADAIARYAAPDVRLVAGGRTKHMTPAMNRVLRRHFASVRGSLGARKCRALLAEGPLPAEAVSSYPLRAYDEDLGLWVCAHGGAFAGPSIDLGTRFLIGCFDRLPSAPRQVVDLGCGTGVLAVAVARGRPQVEVLAIDDSRAAVRSAAATAEANGLADRIREDRRYGLAGLPDQSLDLVVCNPPFHRGPAKDSTAAYAMFADAGRALRPGGELWVVYNSHLPYRTELRRVGHTEVVAQDPRFTVTRSVVR